MTKQITFKAYIPPIQSALKFGGNIARITLEVPETELQNALPLVALQNCSLQITVEMDEGVQTIKSVKASKEKGEWGDEWNTLFGEYFYNNRSLHDALNLPYGSGRDDVKIQLRKEFDVESLSYVSMNQLADWANKHQLPSLETTARRLEQRRIS